VAESCAAVGGLERLLTFSKTHVRRPSFGASTPPFAEEGRALEHDFFFASGFAKLAGPSG